MDLNFPVEAKIQRPIDEVFDAVYNPKKLSQYFTTGGASGSLDEGKTVMIEFADFPGAFPIHVKQSIKKQKIVFEWEANDGSGKGAGYNTKVEFNFEQLTPNTTKVTILESGWKNDEGALKAAVGNAQGWMQMICCLKAFVEYDINLRKGFL